MGDENEVKHDWRAVAFDDTKHWRFPPALMQHVEKILGVYFYDRNECTHCCEITPSYLLLPLDTQVIFKDETPVEIIERVLDETLNAANDEIYMHCRDVDRIENQITTKNNDYTEDEIREHWQGNPPCF